MWSTDPMAPRASSIRGRLAFAFDAREQDGGWFPPARRRGHGNYRRSRRNAPGAARTGTPPAQITRAQESDLPREFSIGSPTSAPIISARRVIAPPGRAFDPQRACRSRLVQSNDGEATRRARDLAAGFCGPDADRRLAAAARRVWR